MKTSESALTLAIGFSIMAQMAKTTPGEVVAGICMVIWLFTATVRIFTEK